MNITRRPARLGFSLVAATVIVLGVGVSVAAACEDDGHHVDVPVIDEPVVDEPVVDVPVIDEPVVDVPVIDEPVVDVPLVIDEPVVDVPVVDTPLVIDVPTIELPRFDELPEIVAQILPIDEPALADDVEPIDDATTPVPAAPTMPDPESDPVTVVEELPVTGGGVGVLATSSLMFVLAGLGVLGLRRRVIA